MFDRSRARAIAASMVAASLSGACATGRSAYDVPLDDPGPMAENWMLPHQIVEGYTGAVLDESALLASLDDARVVYVAERHDRPPDHAVQLAVLAGLYARDPSLALGIEMLPRPAQRFLDAYVQRAYDAPGLLAHVDWEETWGFDFALYRPLFEFARDHGIPIVALNARSEITRAVAKSGLDGIDAALARDIPELELEHAEHRDYIRAAFGLTDEDGEEVHPGFVFENFYQAQVIWDETMADTVARTLTSTAGPRRMVVIAGSGHIEHRFGIPERAARRGAEPFRTILPVVYEDLEDGLAPLIESSIADFIWLMSPRGALPEAPAPKAEARASQR